MARLAANQSLNFEQKTSAPGMWRFPTNPELCCIYRVPHRLRQINPKAYTPQLVILGPLHHSLKSQASKHFLEDIENTRFMGYLSIEQHKKIYLLALTQRFGGGDIINELKSIIEADEEVIRASYSESTTWIQSQEFIEMILQDSVFILEFILRRFESSGDNEKAGDVLIDEPCMYTTIQEDLVLLENQIPYFILEKLFDHLIKSRNVELALTFRDIIVLFFEVKGKINENSKFKHFTDLLRCVHVDSLKLREGEVSCIQIEEYNNIKQMYNAYKLHSAGIEFKVIEEEFSLNVKFEKGCLKIPIFNVDDRKEIILRNVMALEQCHCPLKAYVCDFLTFLDYLIDTDKDVDFLVENGIINNWIGDHGLVAEIVNKLCLGVLSHGSYYSNIAIELKCHYNDPWKRSRAILKRVYFKDLWTGTATIAATFLLLMTLLQTLISVFQFLGDK